MIAPRRMMVTLALLGGFVLLCGTALVALLGLTFALRESPARLSGRTGHHPACRLGHGGGSNRLRRSG